MRFLRFIFSIFIILMVILLTSMLLPSKVTVTKSVLIKATKVQVNGQIQNFSNWKNWYPAFQNERTKLIINLPHSGIIHSVSLLNDKGRKIDFNLLKAEIDTTLIDLVSSSSTKITYQFIIASHPDGATQLTWNVNASLGWYPWNKIKGIFLDKISGPQYEEALKSLKQNLEK